MLNAPQGFTSTNFAFTSDGTAAPEPSSFSTIAGVAPVGVGCIRRRRRSVAQP